MATYNVKNYGAQGDGVTNDTAAIKSAIAAASGGADTVYFPAGTYRVVVSGTTVMSPHTGTTLLGDSQNTSIIQSESTLTAGGTLLWGNSTRRIWVRNLTINGPTDHASIVTYGCNIADHYGGNNGLLQLDYCKLSGGSNLIHLDDQGLTTTPTVTINNCELADVWGIGVAGTSKNLGTITVTNTYIHGYGRLDGQTHGAYIYPGNSLTFDGCTFANNHGSGWAIHIYGLSTTPNQAPVIRNCYFASDSGSGILSSPSATTSMNYCTFNSTTPACYSSAGGMSISHCNFYGNGYAALTSIGEAPSGATVSLSYCNFYTTLNLTKDGYGNPHAHVYAGYAGDSYTVSNCNFYADIQAHCTFTANGGTITNTNNTYESGLKLQYSSTSFLLLQNGNDFVLEHAMPQFLIPTENHYSLLTQDGKFLALE